MKYLKIKFTTRERLLSRPKGTDFTYSWVILGKYHNIIHDVFRWDNLFEELFDETLVGTIRFELILICYNDPYIHIRVLEKLRVLGLYINPSKRVWLSS